VQALKTTLAGIDGDSLLSAVPTIVSDLKRIDTAWTRYSSRSTRTAARSCLTARLGSQIKSVAKASQV
jgi:hypothetical protein